MKKVKKINIKEFRENGYLQEVNRRFLHPLGLAIEITVDADGEESMSGIWDYRNDKEGIYYDIKNSDDERKSRFKKNKEFIDNELKARYKDRNSLLGFDIESIPNSPEIPSNDLILLAAEFDNYKKRVVKEKEELVTNTKVKMLTSLLDMDNDISIALKNVEDEGIKLIGSKISTFLKTQGVESIQTDKYDEDLHEVISVINSDEDKIVDVVSKGYSLNGKPFRYPKIVLGKKLS